MTEFKDFLEPGEADKPVEERLALRGREPVPEFGAAEPLYLRVERLAENGRNPLPAGLGYPGSDGMSTNRGRFSLPEDVLWPKRLHWKVVFAACGEVVACRFASDTGTEYQLEAVHDPTVADPAKELPENYAHSLVCTRVPPNAKHVQPSQAAKKRARQHLAKLFVAAASEPR